MSEIINKVAESGLITIDLEAYYPEGERIAFDMAPLLVEGLLLREKDFRAFIAEHDWSTYKGKHVALFCSTDAIIPRWAWMLLSVALQPFATTTDLLSIACQLVVTNLMKIPPWTVCCCLVWLLVS